MKIIAWASLILAACMPAVYAASVQGPSSSAVPYVTPTQSYVDVVSIVTVGDTVPKTGATTGELYTMVGIPDGLGAYDNGDGTMTVLMNHELNASVGDIRAHGATGAFVSEWIINKSDFRVVSGQDLATQHLVWDPTTGGHVAATGDANRFGRLCSADLPAVPAFYNSATGLGTQSRIYMNGEETGAEGRAYGFIATGSNKGLAYELPSLGKFSWENSVANPHSGDKTVVVGLDDSTPGQVYVYIGDKQSTGNDIVRAGLANGSLYGVKAPLPVESGPLNGSFTLETVNANQTGANLQIESDAKSVTQFARPEDGQWFDSDTFYFVTTGADPDGATGPIGQQSSKLYRLDFASEYTSGQISMVLDAASLTGTDGANARSFDNMTVGEDGVVYIQEDPGNTAYIAKTWAFDPSSGTATQLLESNRSFFFDPVIETPTNVLPPGVLTIDEESSGIIDVTSVLGRNDGKRYFLGDMQAHYPLPGGLVEGGQLYIFSTSVVPEPSSSVLIAVGIMSLASLRRRR